MKPVFLNFTSLLSPTTFTGTTRQTDPRPCQQDSHDGIPKITDLSTIRAERVMCIVDGDNWDISAKNRGLQVRYDRLLLTLQRLAHRVFSVAVITSNRGDSRSADALVRAGWRVLSIQREIFSTPKGLQKIANADSDLCFELGVLSSVANCTAAIIGTGDGNLAISCAAGLKRTYRKPPITVHTLSFAGTTSGRLRNQPDLFRSAILLGTDVLEPALVGRFKRLHHQERIIPCVTTNSRLSCVSCWRSACPSASMRSPSGTIWPAGGSVYGHSPRTCVRRGSDDKAWAATSRSTLGMPNNMSNVLRGTGHVAGAAVDAL